MGFAINEHAASPVAQTVVSVGTVNRQVPLTCFMPLAMCSWQGDVNECAGLASRNFKQSSKGGNSFS
jgi:hypothetical protein